MSPSPIYVDPPDIPEGMTLDEYRRLRVRPPRRGLRARLRRRTLAARFSPSRSASSRRR